MSAAKYVGPLHIQVATVLEHEIAEGVWPAGQSLPCEHTLAKSYHVSIGTMRRALTHLVGRGLIKRQRGRGTIVLRNTPSSMSHMAHRLGSQPEVMGFTAQYQPADPTMAEHLALPPLTRVLSADRLMALDDGSRIFEWSVWPAAFCTGLLDLEEIGFDDWDKEYLRLAIPSGSVDETIVATGACDRIADLLEVERDSPILLLTRRVTLERTPVEYAVSYVALKKAVLRVLQSAIE